MLKEKNVETEEQTRHHAIEETVGHFVKISLNGFLVESWMRNLTLVSQQTIKYEATAS